MAKKGVGGRPAIYGPKVGKVQIRALTKKGRKILDRARDMRFDDRPYLFLSFLVYG